MTDYYQICENALTVLMRSLPEIARDSDVSQGDDSLLSKGIDYAVIVRPNVVSELPILDAKVVRLNWTIELYLLARYKNEAKTTGNLKALRSSAINALINNPTLGNAQWVNGLSFTSIGGVGYVSQNRNMPNSPPAFMVQQINVIVDQTIPRNSGEF